jgi:type I restriction-modification system DNA methylase subunit
MTQTISQDEIKGILWKVCDTFRGTVDPSEYKNYILVMLFVKYISDVWQDKYDQHREKTFVPSFMKRYKPSPKPCKLPAARRFLL